MNKRVFRLVLTLGLTSAVALTSLLCALPVVRSAGVVVYVDADAPGPTHDGTSWATAFTGLQNALTGLGAASSGDQVWIAEGVYTPGPAGTPASTFTIPDGVALYGGFGGGETALEQRDPDAHSTVLSGDLAGDDTVDARGVTLTTASIIGDNAYHVVTVNGVSNATVLDGVIITGGHARTGAASTYGGGLSATGSAISLNDVTFIGNSAAFGGGANLNGGAPSLTRVVFENNAAITTGGALFLQNGSLATISAAAFAGNTAKDGAAIGISSSSPLFSNVAMTGNAASDRGGAIYLFGGAPTLANMSIARNTAITSGSGMYVGNNATPSLANTIVWGNTAPDGAQIRIHAGTPTVSHSLIQGSGGSAAWNPAFGTDSGDNLDADPLFADLAGGDLRLSEGSPAIDTGLDSAVPAGITTDLDGSPRFADGNDDSVATVDMGAYEFGTSAAVSLAIDAVDATQGDTGVRVPVNVALSGAEVLALDLTFSYDATRLTATGVTVGDAATGWAMEYNISVAGEIQVSMANAQALQADGELLTLVFGVTGSEGLAAITWGEALINEGEYDPALTDGSVMVYAPADADFTASPTSGPAPLAVTFTNQATGGFDTFAWTFGDGGISGEANPVYTYTTPGVYTVSLTVSGPGGTATETKTGHIAVYTPSAAAFDATPVDGLAPLEVTFTDRSEGDVATYAWTFGDGETSNLQHLTHTYAAAGTYSVSLTVDGNGGENTVTQPDLVTVRLGTIAGSVRFWQGDRTIEGAAMVLSGDTTATVQTAADGSYTHGGLYRGAYTVTPGDGALAGSAISPYDASLVLRHAVGLLMLNGHAFTAADVTLNGIPTAYDASYILRKAAGSIPLASPAAGAAWQFAPASASYSAFTESLTAQDYVGLLLGDVSGNWGAGAEPAAAGTSAAAEARPVVELALEVTPVDASGMVTATLMLVSAEAPIYSLTLDLAIGDGATTAAFSTGERTAGWLTARNDSPGAVRLVLAGSTAAQSPGAIAHLRFQLAPGQTDLWPVPLFAEADEGAVAVQWHAQSDGWHLYMPLIRR